MEFIEINMHLFGKPEWEFGGKVSPKTIREKGDELKERLYKISKDLQKLLDSGWDCQSTLYDLSLTKDISKSEAKQELKKLGVEAEIFVFDDGA